MQKETLFLSLSMIGLPYVSIFPDMSDLGTKIKKLETDSKKKSFFIENTMIAGRKLEYLVYFNLKSVVLELVLKSHFVPVKFLNKLGS